MTEVTDKRSTFDAILFDMDGTLIDSTPGVLRAWEIFSRDYSLGDHLKIAHETHGRRLYDTLREYCHIDDENKLRQEIDRFEDEVISGGPVALPGAQELLNKGRGQAICLLYCLTNSTLASNTYANKALERAGLPIPRPGIITSNDVSQGKPHPDPYLAGALKLGVDPERCLVVEDALSGIKAGRSAGSHVLALCTTTSKDRIHASATSPDFIIPDLRSLAVTLSGEQLEIDIHDG